MYRVTRKFDAFSSSRTHTDAIFASLSHPYSRYGSLLSLFPQVLPSFLLVSLPSVGTASPRLSTRHLFAGAIWKFNACALARKITLPFQLPPIYSHARSKLSLTFSDLCLHIHKHVDTDTHTFIVLFTHFWLTTENFILTFVRSRYFSCRYMRIYLLIMSYSDFIFRELPPNLFYIKIQNFFIFHFSVWREKDYAKC